MIGGGRSIELLLRDDRVEELLGGDCRRRELRGGWSAAWLNTATLLHLRSIAFNYGVKHEGQGTFRGHHRPFDLLPVPGLA